jgi:hypothetical protein
MSMGRRVDSLTGDDCFELGCPLASVTPETLIEDQNNGRASHLPVSYYLPDRIAW